VTDFFLNFEIVFFTEIFPWLIFGHWANFGKGLYNVPRVGKVPPKKSPQRKAREVQKAKGGDVSLQASSQ